MTSIIVDANIAIYSVIGAPNEELQIKLVKFWEWTKTEEIELFAPRLWWSETTSILRTYVFQKLISESDANDAIQILSSLRLAYINEGADLSARALHWARLLNQAKAYDAMYLSVAESLSAEFWTADARLVNRCRDIGLIWVRNLAEI
jgi:predicted nucleic acid-binding protein